jgi:signal transduction histidine kinase
MDSENPAAVALAHVNLLRLEQGEDAHLNHIEQALNNICNLVQDMLFTSQTRHELYEVDLSKILNEILETYRAAWPEISFLFAGEEKLSCCGHETSLRMIFSNLIKNAVEAIEAGELPGKIEIDTHQSDEFLQIRISDNAFARFCANETRPIEKPHGNGLGLAICRNLANGLGAQISVDERDFAVTVKLRTFCPTLHSM